MAGKGKDVLNGHFTVLVFGGKRMIFVRGLGL